MKQKGVMSELHIYLNRPPELHELTYKQFCKSYDYKTDIPRDRSVWYQEVYLQQGPRNTAKKYYIYKLKKPRTVVRLNPVPWDCGEMWWLRMIMLHKPVISSLSNAKRVNGVDYQTFQDAAAALGLLENTNEAELCFVEAVGIETPPQLRVLFVILTIQGKFNSKIKLIYPNLI